MLTAAKAIAAAAAAAAKESTILTAIPLSSFQPRTTFDVSTSITRSYFLGHHHAALNRMRTALSNVGLIIECRDFRVPISSWNPLLEQSLAHSAKYGNRSRIVVYTHRDLTPDRVADYALNGPVDVHKQSSAAVIRLLTKFHSEQGDSVLFLGQGEVNKSGMLLKEIKAVAQRLDSLTGLRAMVVGMPNAGKSTLLNRLRSRGMNLPKAAKTGSEPGVTRKLGTPVRIVPGEDHPGGQPGMGEGVFLVDTPGVFVPYVSDPESMLKLALVGCVKDGVISSVTVADYLLYHLNLAGPEVYVDRFGMTEATNDVHEFLRGAAKRTGKLKRSGDLSLESAADWVVQEWRKGSLGRMFLDEVTKETLGAAVEAAKEPTVSMNQARKRFKVARKEKGEAKRAAAGADDGL
ncbi:P-loop containing nucleoside triphosphate hydrolase protein [Podospora fimiseda]|uniref:P-loop containing nucleoside triphosphate hydrolase protein n=1 Tax=Podospora fimiseda TaxID=252190 RepID=A0AAN7BKV4_9PEZI|nr:P-loop containing nucleoside triphosphate hydrolase protein [Podospora fimiseda]